MRSNRGPASRPFGRGRALDYHALTRAGLLAAACAAAMVIGAASVAQQTQPSPQPSPAVGERGPGGEGRRIHVVGPGDSLTSLARRYGVTIQALIDANRITDPNLLRDGQRLIISSGAADSKPAPKIPLTRIAAGQPRTASNASAEAAADEDMQLRGTQRGRQAPRISLTFSNVEVRDVLSQIAGYARTDILLTPGAKGNITLNLRNRTPDEAIRLAAAAAGLTVVRTGGVYMVGPAAEVRQAAGEFGVTEVVPLTYAAPADVVAALGKIAPTVRAEATKTGVIITGLQGDLDAARAAIRELDVQPAPPAPPAPETDVENLKFADPAAIERVLSQVAPNVKVTIQDRSLVLRGAPADVQAASHTIQSLDVEVPRAPEAAEAVVYRLKYLNAQTAERQLNMAFGAASAAGGGVAGTSPTGFRVVVAPEPIAPPAANFNPLVGGFTSGGGGGGGGGSTGGGGGGVSGGGGGTGGGGGGGGLSGGGGGTGGAGGSGGITQQLSRATRLILMGPRSSIDLALRLLQETDLPQPMVRIEAAVIEITNDALENTGVTWDFTNTGLTFTQPAGTDLRFGSFQRSSLSFSATLQALITKNRARVLASPNVSVVDNEDASIFIGELVRFKGTTVVTQNATVQGTEAAPVGIALLVRPHIHPDGNVTLKVHPVVSSLENRAQVINNGDPPQTQNREAETTVRLKSGEELVIGGLDQTEHTTNWTKVPILGDLPIISHFFRSRSESTRRSQIVAIIRAYPVLTEPAPANDFRGGKSEK